MTDHAAARVALGAGIASLICLMLALFLMIATHPVLPPYPFWMEVSITTLFYGLVGTIIALRRPRHRIGWLFIFAAVLGALQFLTGQYATVSNPFAALPLAAEAAWISQNFQTMLVLPWFFLLLLFPTGKLLSPRWRFFAWLILGVATFAVISTSLMPGPVQPFTVDNPFGIEVLGDHLRLVEILFGGPLLVAYLGAILALVLRFIRAQGHERQQLKLFTYAAVLGPVALFGSALLLPELASGLLGNLVWAVVPSSLAVAAGIAILRHRLYDIDIIIHRTLVYAVLSASLLLIYFGSVVLLQRTLGAFMGSGSQLAVVISTLTIAALFNPLRQRIQTFIDRRFYRRKYDAQKTLAAFGTTLRNEVELDKLTHELLKVVDDTMQPEHVSIWLREGMKARQEASL